MPSGDCSLAMENAREFPPLNTVNSPVEGKVGDSEILMPLWCCIEKWQNSCERSIIGKKVAGEGSTGFTQGNLSGEELAKLPLAITFTSTPPHAKASLHFGSPR